MPFRAAISLFFINANRAATWHPNCHRSEAARSPATVAATGLLRSSQTRAKAMVRARTPMSAWSVKRPSRPVRRKVTCSSSARP